MALQAVRTVHPARLATRSAVGRLNRYQVLDELGRGGMGIVCKARDRKLDRLVAIKLLPREWCRDEVARERFMQEARAASAIDHQNICTIHDTGSTKDGQLFIVMAHYEGETLKARLERGDLETRDIVDITTQIARGLEAAHARGIVHRDIKPGNIALCPSGVVKILDFGLARRFSTAKTSDAGLDGLDNPGRPLGTANYMAPERILGMPPDPRSDIFSLGVVMYEMATNRRPFAGTSPGETVMNVLDRNPEPLTLVSPSRPKWLQRIVNTALAKDATDRYQSVVDLRHALQLAGSVGSYEPAVNDRPALRHGSR